MELTDWLQVASAAVLAITAVFILFQAIYSRKLVSATISSFAEGNVQLSLVPYGSQGALNLRITNVGSSVVNNVRLSFPCGLMRTTRTGIENLLDSGLVPLKLGSLGPQEKREWFLLNTTDPSFEQLPKLLPYTVEYEVATKRGKKTSSGAFNLRSYKGSLIRAYVNLDDVCRQLAACTKAIGAIAQALSEQVHNTPAAPSQEQ